MVYEDSFKIIIKKFDNANWNCTSETFEFDTINDYENWKRKQNWVRKVKKVSDFKSVKEV